MNAKENLREEHAACMRIFTVLQQICEPVKKNEEGLREPLERIISFLEVYVDQCHHKKEERFLFPALVDVEIPGIKDLIGELRLEHQTGRTLVREMKTQMEGFYGGTGLSPSKLVDIPKQYIGIFRKHIRRENAELLPQIEIGLSDQKLAWLSEQFERIENEQIGRHRYEAFREMSRKPVRLNAI